MRKLFLLVPVVLLAGCHGEKASPKPKVVDEEVRQRADQAHRSLSKESGDTIVSSEADAAEPSKAKLIGKDAVNNCTWLEAEAVVRVGDQDTRKQVQAAAQAEASKKAMQDFLGVDIKSRKFDFQQESLRGQEQLVESILQTTRRGREIDHKVVDEGYRSAPGCKDCLYHMTYRSCIVPLPSDADHDFQVELSLSRTTYLEGDEAKIKVTATKDCWAYLYDVGMDGETALVVPNEYFPEVKLKAGESFEYPDEETRRKGVKLVAQLPEGKTVSAETIRLVATKVPLSKDKRDPAMGGYESLLRRMNSSRLEWVDDQQAFTITKH